MSSTGPPSGDGVPGVGNILGFSLLFRERKALLALNRRGLGPGVRLREYEAEIPGVQFPLQGRLSAANFRNRRCRAVKANLSFEDRALRPWLEARLLGMEFEGVRVQQIDVHFRRNLPGQDRALPSLIIEGTGPEGRVALFVALALEPEGRRLRLKVAHHWLVGTYAGVAKSLLEAVAERLEPVLSPDGELAWSLDPARLALTRAFVSAGWKAPDCGELAIESLAVERRSLSLDLREGNGAAHSPPIYEEETRSDPVERALGKVREQLGEGRHARALETLRQVSDVLEDDPVARLAVVRWRVDLSRFRDRAACLEAAREWLDLRPSASEPRRLVALHLAMSGQHAQLARMLAAQCRAEDDPTRRGHLELALATTLVAHLDDPRSALAIVSPLVQRLRAEKDPEDAVRKQLADALITLARARIGEAAKKGGRALVAAPHAVQALDEALDLSDSKSLRAEMRHVVASSFARFGAHSQALRLLMPAIEEAPEAEEILDDAVELSLRVGEREAAVELLEHRLAHAHAGELGHQRRKLVRLLMRATDDEGALTRAHEQLEACLEEAPDDSELLRMMATVERRRGDLLGAANRLERLLDDPEAAGSLGTTRQALAYERAELLRRAGRSDEAWILLRDLIRNTTTPDERHIDILELALTVAPPLARPELIDHLIEVASGPRRGAALVERAAQAIAVPDRLRDLWQALDEVERPSPILRQIEQLVTDDDLDSLEKLADAATRHHDNDIEARARLRAGRALAEDGALEEARVELQRAHELDPRRAAISLAFAQVLEASDQHRRAASVLGDLLDSGAPLPDGESTDALALRVASTLASSDPVASLTRVRGIGDGSTLVEQRDNLAFELLQALGDTESARELAREASKRPGHPARWLARLGSLDVEPRSRLRAFRKAREADPNDASIASLLAEALEAAGEDEELEALLRHRLDREALEGSPRADVLDALRRCVARRDPEHLDLVPLHRELFALRPDDANLALDVVRVCARADLETALAAWQAVTPQLSQLDERIFEPALALARACLDRDEETAMAAVGRAIDVRPDDTPSLEMLAELGRRRQDSRAVARASEALLVQRPTDATLALDAARARERLREPDAAFEHLERAATNVEARSVLHLEIAERWLALALAAHDLPQQARARAEMRAALARDLPVDEIVHEVRLLGTSLKQPAQALNVLAETLVSRDAPDVLLELLRETAPGSEYAARRVAVLREVMSALGPGAGRARAAARLAVEADESDDAQAVVDALDEVERLQGEDGRGLDEAMARARNRAVRALGTTREEMRRLETMLLEDRLSPDHPRFQQGLERLRDLIGDEPQARARRFLALGERATRRAAVAFCDAALAELVEHLEDPTHVDLASWGLAALVGHGAPDMVRRHWDPVERAVRAGADPDQVATLVCTAPPGSVVAERGRALLDDFLPRFPDAPALQRALWDRLAPADYRPSSNSVQSAQLERTAGYLEALAKRRDLPDGTSVLMLDGMRAAIDDDSLAALLRDRALRRRDQPAFTSAIADRLRANRRWGELAELYEQRVVEADAAQWDALAEGAAADALEDVEIRAREAAAVSLLEGSDEDVESAIRDLDRVLELQPRRADLRAARGRGHQRLGHEEQALQDFEAVLAERGDGVVDRGELALASARLLDARDRSAEALVHLREACTHAHGELRNEAIEELFNALVRVGQNDDASALAGTAAAEAIETEARMLWLRRAAEHASGRRRAEFLRRARNLAPADLQLLDALEAELRDLDDHAALESLLRERVHRHDDPGAIERLIPLAERRGAKVEERIELFERLLAVQPKHVDALLGLAQLRAPTDTAGARALWARAAPLVHADDPRFAGPARALAEAAFASDPPNLEEAIRHVDRSLALVPDDERALELSLRIAISNDDLKRCESAVDALLKHNPTPPRRVELELARADALASAGRSVDAVDALLGAAAQLDPDEPVLGRLALRAVELARNAEDQAGREADALALMHRALGRDYPRDARDREVELSMLLGRHDRALVLLEEALGWHPGDAALLRRYREVGEAEPDAYLRSLRRVLDGLEASPERDQIARALAEDARTRDAARTALAALDKLSGAVAGEAGMLDVREWAVRALGSVDDELAAVERELTGARPTPVAVERLLRMLERDAEATAARLLELATRDGVAGANELCRHAFGLVRDDPSSSLALAVRAIATLGDLGDSAVAEIDELAERAFERSDARTLAELVEFAHRGSEPARARALTVRGLRRFPEQLALHRAAGVVFGSDDEGVDAMLSAVLSESDADQPIHAWLLVGHANTLEDEDASAFLAERARRHAGDPGLFQALGAALRRRGALPQLVSLHAELGAPAPLWLELADAAADAADRSAEVAARSEAGFRLLGAGELRDAQAQFGRAHELEPEDRRTREGLASTHRELGEFEASMEHYEWLLAEERLDESPSSTAELGSRAGEVARELERLEDAERFWGLAIDASPEDHERALALAERRWSALRELKKLEAARELAERAREWASGPERALWLKRSADGAPAERRTELLREALTLTPADSALADALEDALIAAEDREAVETLLRRRVQEALATGASPETAIALLERLLSVVEAGAPGRADLLETLVRLDPANVGARIELGISRISEGASEAGAEHLRSALDTLRDDDPGALQALRALAEVSIAEGDAEGARDLLVRALDIEPAHTELLESTWRVARTLDEGALELDCARRRLAKGDLQADELARWSLSLASRLWDSGQTTAALDSFAEAAGAAIPRGDLHLEVAERWLNAVTEPPAAPRERARARAQLREALGEELPPTALRAEALLLAEELDEPDHAIGLLEAGLRRAPSSGELLEALERIAAAEHADGMLGVLDSIAREAPEPEASDHLQGQRARLAYELGFAEHCLDAIEQLPEGTRRRDELAKWREWAIRKLGRVSVELEAITKELRNADDRAGLNLALAELLRFSEPADAVATLVDLCNEEPLPREVGRLAELALDVARDRVPDDVEAGLAALEAVAAHSSVERMAGAWPEVEARVCAGTELDAMVRLLRLAVQAEGKEPLAYGTRVERIAWTGLRLDAGSPELHEAIAARDGDKSSVELVERICAKNEASDTTRHAAVLGALQRLGEVEAARELLARGRDAVREPAFVGYVEALAERSAWPALLSLLRAAGSELELEAERIREFAEAAAIAGDDASEAGLRRLVASHLADPVDAVAELQRVVELEPGDTLIRFRLAVVLEAADRPDAALEYLLPLLDESIGLAESKAHLCLRCARLLLRTNDEERAIANLERAVEGIETSDEAWIEAAERLSGLLAERDLGRARELARAVVERSAEAERPTRLRRAASLEEDLAARVELLEQAATLAPDDVDVAEELEAALREAGDASRLLEVLEARLLRAPADQREALSSRLVAAAEDSDEATRSRVLARRLEIVADDVEALLALGDLRADERKVHPHPWARAGELLADEDDRFFGPARVLASWAREEGELGRARALLERALRIRPGDSETTASLHELARALDDPELVLSTAKSLLELGQEPAQRATLELRVARALERMGSRQAALDALRRATEAAPEGSELAFEAAASWVDLAADRGMEGWLAEDEVAARAALRRVRGDELPVAELRAEARILCLELGRVEDGLSLLDERLSATPTDDLVLSAFKDLCHATNRRDRYIAALERALDDAGDAQARDLLATELAFSAVEVDDAARLLRVLDRVSPERAGSPELLDLREWAVRHLDRVDDEVSEIDDALLGGGDPEFWIPRLLRMLEGDRDACAEHLLRIAERTNEPTNLAAAVLGLSHSAEPAFVSRALEALERCLVHPSDEPADRVAEAMPSLEKLALDADDPAALARVISAERRALERGWPVGDRPDELLRVALSRYPGESVLHELVLATIDEAAEDRLSAIDAAVQEVADAIGVDAERRTSLWIGMAGCLERLDAAKLLDQRARAHLDDQSMFSAFLSALEGERHWPNVLELLELYVERREEEFERIWALKRLAHICTDILGDNASAIAHLERALEIAPEDPDLQLPLLDHYFAESDLTRAIDLSVRVLDHVPMGSAAFAALGHRAADAALANGDHGLAERLLKKVLDRCGDEARTASRLAELEDLKDSPAHRVRMLAAVANRQSGSARIEALEERARLLVDPLGRVEEAIADLEALLDEEPGRESAGDTLAELYARQEHWSELVALLERRFPREPARRRAQMLRQIATIHRESLFDLPRAEEALRLALDTIGEGPSDDEMRDRTHAELVDVLEQQGRTGDVIGHLQDVLEPVVSGQATPREAQIELLAVLAHALLDVSEDHAPAAACYERLEQLGALPDEGLAVLARHYRSLRRYEDLVRILRVRSTSLGEAGDRERKAEVDMRIGDLLEGPLRRPHEAARYFLDAYVVDPVENTTAGARARVLLSGTDSVVNVRRRLRERLEAAAQAHRPALLALLADILAPHEEHEVEAERAYRAAIERDDSLATAQQGLGRLLARQGRLEEAVEPLSAAARSDSIDPEKAADDAATAARALLELGRGEEAELLLRDALGRAPEAQRALLELARLYDRLGRKEDEAHILDDLANLPLSSMLRAEVSYRRAMLLRAAFEAEPLGEEGEMARAFLLEAVGADAMHAAARQVLLDLATARGEWSIVAHMHFLAIRELPPGTPRALIHLDLAQTYLQRLNDQESAVRNIVAALSMSGADLVVHQRACDLVEGVPDRTMAAERLETQATHEAEIDAAARARMFLLASDLYLAGDDHERAQRAARAASKIDNAGDDAMGEASRRLDTLADGEVDLHRQRKALERLLETEDNEGERLHILGRLRDIGGALDDEPLVERSTTALLELAHSLGDSDEHREAATLALRDLFAQRGDYAGVVELYERLAERSEDVGRAARMLTDAARFAWSGLRDARLAVAILRRVLERRATSPAATELLGEIAGATDDPQVDETICSELAGLDPATRSPLLSLRLAEAALRLDRQDESRAVLEALIEREDAEPKLQYSALALLDGLLARAELPAQRVEALRRRYDLCRLHFPDRAAETALELARTQRAIGATDEARNTCDIARRDYPTHIGLAHLHAELLELAEDWEALAATLEALAHLEIDGQAKAAWLVRAARVHLDHGSEGRGNVAARRLLVRAREAERNDAQVRELLIPLAFEEGRWDDVLELAVELRSIAGDGHASLLYAAIVEPYSRGKRTLARSIGARHTPAARQRILFPVVARVLEVIAVHGPLPRLDAVLGAAAALTGSTEELLDELGNWAAGHPVQSGMCVALGRLHEAFGRLQIARDLFQLAAFLAPHGGVPQLAARLAAAEMPADPLHEDPWIPLEWRGALREVLIQLRTFLAGMRFGPGSIVEPRSPIERAAVHAALRPLARWETLLGLEIPVGLTRDALPAGIGVRNENVPSIVVHEDFVAAPEAERSFRLAFAAASIATGTAIVSDTNPVSVRDLIDALIALAQPRHVASQEAARVISDTLASRGLTAGALEADLRQAISQELEYWSASPDRLAKVLWRANLLIATRLSGSLNGALSALARDFPEAGGDPARTLDTEEARWLLRAVGLSS